MYPVIVRFGALEIGTHAFFTVLGACVAIVASWQIALRRDRADQDLLWIIAGGMLTAAVFSRYGLVIRYAQESTTPTLDGFLRYGGKTLLGGLTGGYLGVLLTKRLLHYARHTGDLFAPGAALGIAIGRVGCFLTERPGTPTTLPWGVRASSDVAAAWRDCAACATGAAMHPSFLYEAGFLFVAAWWLFRAMRTTRLPAPWMKEGDVFKLFLLAYALFRFAVEFVRGNPVMAFGLSGSQLMVLPASIALTVYFLRRRQDFFAAGLTPSLR